MTVAVAAKNSKLLVVSNDVDAAVNASAAPGRLTPHSTLFRHFHDGQECVHVAPPTQLITDATVSTKCVARLAASARSRLSV